MARSGNTLPSSRLCCDRLLPSTAENRPPPEAPGADSGTNIGGPFSNFTLALSAAGSLGRGKVHAFMPVSGRFPAGFPNTPGRFLNLVL